MNVNIKFHSTVLFVFSLFFFITAFESKAQFVLEPFVSEESLILESWYFNTIDESQRLSIFNLNEAKYTFETNESSVFSYGIMGYNLAGGFGPMAGWRVTNYSAAALAGLQYGFYRENFLAYVVLNSELKQNPNMEFYTLIQYRPKLTEKLKGFSQLQTSTNFTADGHAFSLYRLRLGVDFGKIQTGIGLEHTMAGPEWERATGPGFFVRLELY